ncbi:MAG: hypothetical protein GY832_17800 [Chloroflexi bacterium]|nr:hypothetical protein [Chloroflexota bacterium]
MTTLTQAQQMEAFRVALENANRPSIAPLLATWGYDESARTADLELLSQAHAARTDQQREISEADVAHKAKAQAKKTARTGFVLLQRFIRTANRNHPELNIASTLDSGALPKAEAAFLTYTTALLDRIAAHPDVAAALAELGYRQERLDQLRPLLDAISQTNVAQAKEQGEAERATSAYNALLEQVRIAYNYIKLIATEALKDDPQLVEIMGLGKV